MVLRFAAVFLILGLAIMPIASTEAMPITPTERSCVVAPIKRVDLEDAAAGPVPRRADPVESNEPVTDEELRQISRVVRIMTACTNANRPLSALALVTDTCIAEYFAGPAGQDQLGHLIAASSREPEPAAPEDRLTLVSIENPVRYEGGRIAVTVTTANATTQFVDLLFFIETEDGWRLDQAELGDSIKPQATPV